MSRMGPISKVAQLLTVIWPNIFLLHLRSMTQRIRQGECVCFCLLYWGAVWSAAVGLLQQVLSMSVSEWAFCWWGFTATEGGDAGWCVMECCGYFRICIAWTIIQTVSLCHKFKVQWSHDSVRPVVCQCQKVSFIPTIKNTCILSFKLKLYYKPFFMKLNSQLKLIIVTEQKRQENNQIKQNKVAKSSAIFTSTLANYKN